uniref:HelD family protein n=1 Tax=Tessaracoccus bendigoensis TaxID=72764 RepID=UPI0009338FE5|nr:UvrD-helicase domain-containing protein [Tessaracoccus bendigoensis]
MSNSRADLNREIALEQAHVDRVYDNLNVATASAKSLAESGREIYVSDRTSWTREEDSTALFERDAFAYQAARRLAILDAEHEGLVFGRIDLADDDARYIGRIGVRDRDYEPLVIDWRAPAAEPFYRATPTAPMGAIRRRVLRCRDDKVIGLEDDLLDSTRATNLPIIGEGALMASLTRARGRTMRDIVATIQAEQDEAIRAPYQGVTIIAGGPGTGKTVVALHRAAYLLYTNRARLERGGVLVVGPTNVFMNYIERVLPSLGEESVTLKAIGSVASDTLGMSSERMDNAEAATVKGSLAMVKLLGALVRTPLNDHPEALRVRVTVKGEVLTLDADALARIRDQVLSQTKLNRGHDLAFNLVVSALKAKLPEDVEISPVELDEQVREHPSLTRFMASWWPALSATRVLARLSDPRLTHRLATQFTPQQRESLSGSYAWLRGSESDADTGRGWSIADIALLDELVHILGPVPDEKDRELDLFAEGEVAEVLTTADLLRLERSKDPAEDPQSTYAHILVDEGQDVTPMQWRMLRRRGPQSSWTIVGDPAQSSYPFQDQTTSALDELIGRAKRRTFTLSTNYRSPSEVFDLAARVITKVYPDAELPRAVRSTGIEPLLTGTDSAGLPGALRKILLDLAGTVNGTIGIITPPSRLRDIQLLVLGDERLREFEDRLIVVTALQAKGLEYDGVVVVSPDEIVAEAPGGARVLYVALTRATQRLVTLDVETSQWRGLLD